MNFSPDDPFAPEHQNSNSQSSEELSTSHVVDAAAPTETSIHPGQEIIPYGQRPDVPEDLRISWSWVHFLCFIGFSVLSLIVVQSILVVHYSPHEQLSPKELQDYLLGLPQFVVGTTIALIAIVFLFLYVTLSVLPEKPFWSSLGWRNLQSTSSRFYSRPWFFVLLGALFSLIVAIASSQVPTPKDMPIEALMKSRTGFILMMSMGVVVAPVAEETIFRGYLYPLLVRLISTSGQHFGASTANATRVGINISIVVTGILFGLLHGQQLSWTWGIVSLLIVVGIVFTFVRARTGSVFASFLMHFGYNLFLAIVSLIETHGLRNLPPN